MSSNVRLDDVTFGDSEVDAAFKRWREAIEQANTWEVDGSATLVAEAESRHGPQLDMAKRNSWNPTTNKRYGFTHGYAPDPEPVECFQDFEEAAARCEELVHEDGYDSGEVWADSGDLACVKTPGGHRRFGLEEISRFQRSTTAAEGLLASVSAARLLRRRKAGCSRATTRAPAARGGASEDPRAASEARGPGRARARPGRPLQLAGGTPAPGDRRDWTGRGGTGRRIHGAGCAAGDGRP